MSASCVNANAIEGSLPCQSRALNVVERVDRVNVKETRTKHSDVHMITFEADHSSIEYLMKYVLLHKTLQLYT